MRELTLEEIDGVSGAGFWGDVGRNLDYALSYEGIGDFIDAVVRGHASCPCTFTYYHAESGLNMIK